MRVRHIALPALAVMLTVAGCRKQDPVDMPTPTPSPAPAPPPAAPPPAPPPGGVDPNVAIERARAEMINTLGQPVYFDFDRFEIRMQDEAILDRKAGILAQYPQVRIRIAGHADERGSDEYNLVLGNNRALAAKAYLERKGIAGNRIDVISYGEERPVDPASTEAAWARNRRAEFEVVAGRETLGMPR